MNLEYEYYEDEPLPSGPTREAPLPSGPTRRPGQARTFSPKPRNTDSSALNQFLNLPLLTTQRPRKLKVAKNITRKQLLEQLGPFHGHFIAPPKLNAGKSNLVSLIFEYFCNRFPPFNTPATVNRGDSDMR